MVPGALFSIIPSRFDKRLAGLSLTSTSVRFMDVVGGYQLIHQCSWIGLKTYLCLGRFLEVEGLKGM